jgi:hypothetical protein
MGVESLRNGLLEDLNRAKLEEKRLSDQVLANAIYESPLFIKNSFELLFYQQCNLI